MSFFEKIEKHIGAPMAKVANQKYLMAVRNGMVSTIPLTIVGSLFLIIAFPPVPQSWKESMPLFQWITANIGNLLIPFRMSMGLLAIFAVYNTAYHLAKHYKMDGVTGGTLALVGFFLTIIPKTAQTMGDKPEELGYVLPVQYLGSQGIFGGLIIAILAVEVLRFFYVKKLIIKMPDGVPEAVSKSFAALIPTLFFVVVLTILVIFLHFDIHSVVGKVFQPLGKFLNGPTGAILTTLLITVLWSCGLHGDSIVGAFIRPLWLELLAQNSQAMSEGAKILPNIAPEPFFQWFVWIGGSGCTLGLVFLMLFSKSAHLKMVGKTALVPGLFNINEPVVFGVPIMLNPFMIIPFILGPVVITITTYIIMAANLVGRPAILAPWTFPAPIGAFLSTNGSFGAVILVFINIAITTLIFFPFFKAYEKKLLADEKNNTPQD